MMGEVNGVSHSILITQKNVMREIITFKYIIRTLRFKTFDMISHKKVLDHSH